MMDELENVMETQEGVSGSYAANAAADTDVLSAEVEALRGERAALLREREALLYERALERALASANVCKVDKVRALLDVEALEVDADGSFVNLADQLLEIEREAPGFFVGRGGTAAHGRLAGTGGVGNFGGVQSAAAVAEDNPWAVGNFNLTKQGEVMRRNPALAQRMKRQAGM